MRFPPVLLFSLYSIPLPSLPLLLSTVNKITHKNNTTKKMSDSHVYVHCKQHSWVPARVIEKKGDLVTVSIPTYVDEQRILSDGGKGAIQYTRETIDLNQYPNKVLPLQNVDEMGWLNEERDMTNLPFLHEVCVYIHICVFACERCCALMANSMPLPEKLTNCKPLFQLTVNS
jgi:hypothetical protein